MRVSYREMSGKKVVTRDGRNVGRIVDLLAEPNGGSLCVTRLLVGPRSFLARIGFKRARRYSRGSAPSAVPWGVVTDIGKDVRLRITYAELQGMDVSEPGDQSAPAPGSAQGKAE